MDAKYNNSWSDFELYKLKKLEKETEAEPIL